MLVVIVVVGFLALLLMLGLTRSREAARSAICSRNLQQIGIALELYQQATQTLPTVPRPRLGGTGPSAVGPLALLIEQLDVPDLNAIDRSTTPPTGPGTPADEGFIPGFVCPSDPIATARIFPAPVNYRANTGSRTDGRRGPFSPGVSTTFAEVEAGHGASYTAAFAERLVGTGGTSKETARDYRVVPGPIPDDGCPDAPEAPLQSDAGRSWLEADWRSTLYTHAAPPGSPRSCIAEDGRSAFLGASSGHVEGVRVLLLDGSVRVYATTVAPPVWSALGSFRDEGEEGRPPGPLSPPPPDSEEPTGD